MKVAFCTYPNTNQNIGGVQMRVNRTFKELRKAGVDVELFDQWRHHLSEFEILHSFKLHHSVQELVLTANKRRVCNVISTVLPPEYPVRTVRVMSEFWKRNIGRNLLAHTIYSQAKVADGLIAVSRAEANIIENAFSVPADKIHVISNCADAALYGSADPSIFREKFELERYVLMIGRVEPNKNQLRLIRAMKAIDLPLVVVGRISDDAQDYAAQCRKEGGGRVKFIDHLPYNSELLASAYAGAEAFVLPSVSEIAPNSTIEAAMAGTRIVVTRNSLAPAEWFGGSATYVNPLDEQDIAEQLNYALKRPRDLPFRSRILDEFSWESGVKKLKTVYETVLERRG
ncbi:glycosyltransferase [Massilia aerilata]|uniref:Glycosyltransferase n=1 Tax=Massilia aerilata TaxID=453817 RepID=A0ABW0RUJ5_9BURK